MTKEEYGELLKHLGILRYSIHKLRDKERDFELKKEVLKSIELLLNEIPILEEYIKN